MREAITLRRHAAGLGALVLVFLLLPEVQRLLGLPSRSVVYDGISHFAGNFVRLRHVV